MFTGICLAPKLLGLLFLLFYSLLFFLEITWRQLQAEESCHLLRQVTTLLLLFWGEILEVAAFELIFMSHSQTMLVIRLFCC